jgi:LasA protease
MRLPYAVDQAWSYTGGPHPMAGDVRSSIDLAGGDGRVLAARAGVAYTMCDSGTGWLRVVHDRGFATDYYHLADAIAADGRRVEEGEFLGRIGTDVSCGGSATGPHVHFSLRRDGRYVPIDRYSFGKWAIRAGDDPYEGYALHGSTRVAVGGTLRNHGALRLTEGVVDTDGGGALNRRAGPGTDHEVVGTLPDGATVRVRCSARGTTHTGRGGYTSDLWNRLTDGGWVSDVFLWTGTAGPVNGWC